MLSDLRVSTKLLGVIGIVVVATSVAAGWFAVRSASEALTMQTRAQLEAVSLLLYDTLTPPMR